MRNEEKKENGLCPDCLGLEWENTEGKNYIARRGKEHNHLEVHSIFICYHKMHNRNVDFHIPIVHMQMKLKVE